MSKIVTVNTPEELGQALADKTAEIRVEGDLAKRVQVIRKFSTAKWIVVYGALAGAVVGVISGLGLPAALMAAGIAVSLLGYQATVAAVRIGVKTKDPAALHRLRKDYREVARGPDYLVLKRK